MHADLVGRRFMDARAQSATEFPPSKTRGAFYGPSSVLKATEAPSFSDNPLRQGRPDSPQPPIFASTGL